MLVVTTYWHPLTTHVANGSENIDCKNTQIRLQRLTIKFVKVKRVPNPYKFSITK